jgi:hypothetical protein
LTYRAAKAVGGVMSKTDACDGCEGDCVACPHDREILYRFKRLTRGIIMADGVGVHARSMDEAIQKAHKLMDYGDRIEFESNKPCVRQCEICKPPVKPTSQTTTTCEQPATLLASAPLLLSALEGLVNCVETECDTVIYPFAIPVREAREALKSAKGLV